MKYLKRELERKFLMMNTHFKVILVTGARQVGKTTMLRHLAEGTDRTYVSLDNRMARQLAKSDPVLFFQTYRPPMLIDEIQKAPELFEQIKIMCDESDEKGQFWITGSQQYNMMMHVRETLAGRIGILHLYGLSQREKQGVLIEDELDLSLQGLLKRQKLFRKNNIVDTYEHIWTGGMPDILDVNQEIRDEYFNSYVETYLMRDATEAGGVSDTIRFSKFLNACAALVSQQVNYATLAQASDISEPTAKAWLNVLEGLGIIYLLKPYENNALKRLVKMPKLYFCDTALSYYRDSNAKEIDVFIEENDTIHPIEIKKSANPDIRETKKYLLLDKASLKRGNGGIVCMCEEVVPIDQDNCFIPSNII